MANFSFDIVSDYDKAEMNNVFDQVQRELTNRYDFKNTPAAVEWLDADKTGLKITGSGDWQIDTIIEIVRKKLAARNQNQKVIDTSRPVITANLKATKDLPFISGLNQDKARQLTKLIRDKFPKVKVQTQGDAVRVTSSSKDDLQHIIQDLKARDLDYPLAFTNYR